MPFLLNLLPPALQAAVQFVEPVFSLLDVRRDHGIGIAALALLYQLRKPQVLPMDQFVQADLHVTGDDPGFFLTLGGYFC